MTTELKIRLQEWMLEKWKKTAEEDGITLSEWIRQRCEGKNLLGTDAERAKIQEQMKELTQPTEESSGSGTDQDVRRYEELPANPRSAGSSRRQVGRRPPASSRNAKRGGKSRSRQDREINVRCTNAVAPGLYCPKCDRRH